MIAEAQAISAVSINYGYLNVLGCIPWKDPNNRGQGVRPPTANEAEACSPRLVESLRLLRPTGLVFVGKTSLAYKQVVATALPKQAPTLAVQHPAYLLRSGGRFTAQGAKWVSDLIDFLTEHWAPSPTNG